MTGFYRDGCCRTGPQDVGSHTICAVVTAEFLEHQRGMGNDLSTPFPEYGFPGLEPGDRWCVTAVNWARAYNDRVAAPRRAGLDQRAGADDRPAGGAARARRGRARGPGVPRAVAGSEHPGSLRQHVGAHRPPQLATAPGRCSATRPARCIGDQVAAPEERRREQRPLGGGPLRPTSVRGGLAGPVRRIRHSRRSTGRRCRRPRRRRRTAPPAPRGSASGRSTSRTQRLS